MLTPSTAARFTVISIALVNLSLHLISADTLGYHRDELLYMALGHRPDWGYPSVPPLIGWLAAGVGATVGTGVVAVKLLPALLSGLFILLCDCLVREMGGRAYARILLATVLLLMPVTLRTFHLFQPVHLDLLWWTALTWVALRYSNRGRGIDLLWMGLILGFGLLTKYLIALYASGILLGIVIVRPRTLRTPTLYYGGLLALIVFSPNLIWQVAHDFPVIGHMQALRANQLVNVSRAGFLADQLLMAFAGSLLLLPGLIYLLRNQRAMAVAVGFTFISLLLLRGKSYYTLGLFPVILAAGAIWWEAVITGPGMRIALLAVTVAVSLPVLPLGLPIVGQERLIDYFAWLEESAGVRPGRRWEDGNVYPLPQDYADQLGWRELGREVAAAFAREAEPGSVAIYASNYGQAAAVLLTVPDGLPAPISFSDAFNYWVPRRFDRPVEVFYYINDEVGEDVAACFDRVEVIGRIDNPYAREYGTTVYRYSQPNRPFRIFWEEVLARDVSPF